MNKLKKNYKITTKILLNYHKNLFFYLISAQKK